MVSILVRSRISIPIGFSTLTQSVSFLFKPLICVMFPFRAIIILNLPFVIILFLIFRILGIISSYFQIFYFLRDSLHGLCVTVIISFNQFGKIFHLKHSLCHLININDTNFKDICTLCANSTADLNSGGSWIITSALNCFDSPLINCDKRICFLNDSGITSPPLHLFLRHFRAKSTRQTAKSQTVPVSNWLASEKSEKSSTYRVFLLK